MGNGMTSLLFLWVVLAVDPAVPSRVEAEVGVVLAEIAALEASFAEPAQPENKEWVQKKLAHMVAVDQLFRNAEQRVLDKGYSAEERKLFSERVWAQGSEIDKANTATLKELLKIHRWFTVSAFGKEADKNAWLLVQHADLDVPFQKQVLEVLSELYAKAETNPSSYAYLWDRVATNEGRKQRYGTQGKCTGPGTWEPNELEDPARIDELRATVGLMPMADYKALFKERRLCE
jgi:hypothetical protein